MANSVNYVSKNITATNVEGNVTVNVKSVWLLSNDGSADITFNFDNAVTEANEIILKAGEKIENFPVGMTKLYYKAASGSQAFRFMGLK